MENFSKYIILTTCPGAHITAYDPLTGDQLSKFSVTNTPRHGIALAGPGIIAVAHISQNAPPSASILLFNWWSSSPFFSFPVPEPVGPIVTITDGSHMFSGGMSGRVHAFSLPSGDLLRSFDAHSCSVSCLEINEDGSLLVSGSEDGTICVFPVIGVFDSSSDCVALYQILAHEMSITGIALFNRVIVSSSLDCTCKFWNMSSGAHIRTVRLTCGLWCVAVDPTDGTSYFGGSDGHVHVVKIKRVERKAETEVVKWGEVRNGAVTVTAVAMANSNRNLVSVSENGIVTIWDTESGGVIRVLGKEKACGFSNLLVSKCSNAIRRINLGKRLGFSQREILRKVGEVEEMEERLSMVMNDGMRASHMLEEAIETYEKLLSILLKEATRG